MNNIRLRLKFSVIILSIFACNQNIFQKQEKVDPLKLSARELEKGNIDKSFSLFLDALPEESAKLLSTGTINAEKVVKIGEYLDGNPYRKQIMGLLSILVARKSGLDILQLGGKISKSKDGLEPEELITEIMDSLSNGGDISTQIDAAIAASKILDGSNSSDQVNEAILHSASIAARLKSIDEDGDNKVSAEELKNLSEEDSEKIHSAFQETLVKASEAASQDNDQNLQKITDKLNKISEQISNSSGETDGEKTKSFLNNVLDSFVQSGESTPVVTPQTELKQDLEITIIDGKRVVRSMAVLGDSLAVGIGSDFKRGAELEVASINNHPGVAGLLSKMDFPGYDNYKGDLDQAIIASYDSAYSARKETIENCSLNSDAEKCFSHASRLQVPYLKNFAISGSKIEDILDIQLPKLIESDAHIDYIVINIGGNDFCSMNLDMNVFEKKYREVLTKLYNYKSQPIVMIAGVPDVVRLFKSVSETKDAFHLKSDVMGNYDFSCGEIRWMFCPRAAAFKDDLTMQSQVINDMTNTIQNIIDSIDPQRKKLFFAKGLSDLEIDESKVSIDCFHANIDGYKTISEITFSAVKSAILPNQ